LLNIWLILIKSISIFIILSGMYQITNWNYKIWHSRIFSDMEHRKY